MQSLNVFEKGFGYLDLCLEYYSKNCAFFLLYLLCAALIVIKGTKREKQIFIPSLVLLMLTVYNPVFPVFLDKIFDVNSEYYRFFWIAPVVILVPYVATKLVMGMDSVKGKVLLTVFIALIFVVSGNFLYENGYVKASNIYKMPDEMIQISEIIHENSKAEYPKAFLEYEYNMQMRQYDPKMLLTIDREDYLYAVSDAYTEEMLNDEEFPQYRLLAAFIRHQKVDDEALCEALEATGTEYVVLSKMNPEVERLEELDAKVIARTENHIVFEYMQLEEPFSLVDYSVVYPNGGTSGLYHWN